MNGENAVYEAEGLPLSSKISWVPGGATRPASATCATLLYRRSRTWMREIQKDVFLSLPHCHIEPHCCFLLIFEPSQSGCVDALQRST